MRSCYDNLLFVAAAIANSAYGKQNSGDFFGLIRNSIIRL
jgi:hypothetical protein